jgi:serine/threonine-protein kinase HipA
MNILQYSESPDVDRSRFMRAQAFNYVIAGTDAHARNYSIIYAPGGAFRLAPLYDVISDLPYTKKRGAKSTLAMTIGGTRAINEILPRHWERQAKSVRFSVDQTFRHLRDLIAKLPDAAQWVRSQNLEQGLDSPVIKQLADAIEARCTFLARHYGVENAQVTEASTPA